MTTVSPSFTQKLDADGTLRIAIIGPLTESAPLPPPSGRGASSVFIDLAQVEYVSSEGVRSWFKWMKEIEREFAGAPITLEKCSTSIMNQCMSVFGFIPNGVEIASFFIPFHCNECDASSAHLYPGDSRRRGFDEAVADVPKLIPRCPFCGGPTELDAIPDRYLAALKKQK
jgi:hypothetical protein